MAKFADSRPSRRPVSTVIGTGRTFEGATGVKYDPFTELFNLTTAAMVGGEKSFYEDGQVRDDRLVKLTRDIVGLPGGFEWLSAFVPYLRNSMFMRTAPIMVAAEAVNARQTLLRNNRVPVIDSGYTVRGLVSSAIGRPDEFAEFIGYWRMRFGRTIPGGVQRGLADAFTSMINEYNALKYDGTARSYRMGHIIEIIHPEPKAPWQSDLFKYLLDRSKHPTAIRANVENLPVVRARIALESYDQETRERIADGPGFPEVLASAGMTWENAAGWLRRELTASDWAALIPSMGYFALIRNLRNFDKAGVDDATAQFVINKLTDPAQVAKSKLFPYRFYTAYRAAKESMRWGHPLSIALGLATENVPVLPGKTLVLVDTSGSMNATVSERSDVRYVDIAALFASVIAARSDDVDVVAFADTAYRVKFPTKSNVLRNVDHIRSEVGKVGYGTNIGSAQGHLDGHKRVVIFSDMQDVAGLVSRSNDSMWGSLYGARGLNIPAETMAYSFNLAGYEHGTMDVSKPNRFVLAGFSDSAFTMMSMVEAGRDQAWPFTKALPGRVKNGAE